MNIHEGFLNNLKQLRNDVRANIKHLEKERIKHKIEINKIAINAYKNAQIFNENNAEIFGLELENDRLYRALANER